MSRDQVLSTMQSLIYSDRFKKVLEDTKNRDTIFFLGNTKSGKSTTVNYVIGNALNAVPVGKKKFKIVHASEQFRGPKIGMGSQSETTIPSAWSSSKVTGLVVDCPGFDDNRGVAQDVANAFYIKELIKNVNSAKIILIVDIADIIYDNISSFIALMNKLHDMLPDTHKLKNGAMVVFTKDNEDTTVDEICEIFNEKILSQSSLDVHNRDLVNFFVNNKSHIAIVKMPTVAGILGTGNEAFGNLTSAIENNTSKLSRDVLQNISFGISDKARIFLLETQSNLLEFRQFDDLLSAAEVTFNNKLSQSLGTFNTIAEGNNKINWLNELERKLVSSINSNKSASDLLNDFNQIFHNTNILGDLKTIDMKLHFVGFVDEILNQSHSNGIIAKVKNSLNKMKSKLVDYRNNIRIRIGELREEEVRRRIAEEEAAHARRMQQVREQQEELRRQQMVAQQQREAQEKERLQAEQVRRALQAVQTILEQLQKRDGQRCVHQ